MLPFDIPSRGKSLLMHGYTGAVDIVSYKVADQLASVNGDGFSQKYSKATMETLIERGYLTEKTQEEEHEYVGQILDVFKRKTESPVNFAFQLQGPCREIQESLLERLGETFKILNKLRERYMGGVLALDLTRVTDTFDFLPEIIKHANDWSYNLIVTITSDKARQILPYLSQGQLQYLRIASKDPKINKDFKGELVECMSRLLEEGLKGEWLYYVDAETLAGIEQACETAREMKRQSKDKKGKRGKLNFLLVSDGSVIDSNPVLRLKGEFLSVISTQDISLYHFVGRFIEQAGQINFRPYFSPRGSTYVLDSECNVFILPPQVEGMNRGESKKVGRWTDGVIKLDESLVGEYEAECKKIDFSDSCDSCHLSLLCGGTCLRTSSPSSAHDSLPACAVSFRGRLERVIPLVLFNKLAEA